MSNLLPQGGHVGLITPIVSSSATIGLALYQYPQFYAFFQSGTTGKSLSRYWDPMVKQSVTVTSIYCLTSGVSGIFASRWLRNHQTLETTDVGKWYTYGSILAVAHLAFWPLIYGPVTRMIERGQDSAATSEEKVEEENAQDLKTWFLIHTVRTVVDLAALGCFAEGAARSFWIASV